MHAHGEGQHGNIEPYRLLSGLEVTRIQGVLFVNHPTDIQYATANNPIYSVKTTKLKNVPGLAKQAIYEDMRRRLWCESMDPRVASTLSKGALLKSYVCIPEGAKDKSHLRW